MGQVRRLTAVVFVCASLGSGARAQDPPVAAQILIGVEPHASAASVEAMREQLGVTSRRVLPAQNAEVWTMPSVDPATLQRLNASRLLTGADYLAGGEREAFVPISESALSPAAARALADIRSRPLIGENTTVRLRAGNLSYAILTSGVAAAAGPAAEPALTIQRPDGGRFFTRGETVVERGSKTMVSGAVFMDALGGEPAGDLALAIAPEGASGFINVGEETYAVLPLGDGSSTVARINVGSLPPDHPPGFEPAIIDREEAPPAAANAIPVLRVGVAVTPLAAQRVADTWGADMESHLEGIFQIAQAGFNKSGVRVVLEYAGLLPLTANETGVWSADVASLAAVDGRWDEVHAWRSNVRADIVIGLVGSYSACGEAAAIRADKAHAFALVSYLCAQPGLSFVHEIGHLLGARHDEHADPQDAPYAYGHGYVHGNEWRTVMAYKHPAGPCPSCGRVNVWASPHATYKGVVTGTATLNDDVRVLNENAPIAAAFEP